MHHAMVQVYQAQLGSSQEIQSKFNINIIGKKSIYLHQHFGISAGRSLELCLHSLCVLLCNLRDALIIKFVDMSL